MFKKSSVLLSFILLLGLVVVSALATDYHIDPVSGSDTTGDGRLADPWKSFKNITSYYQASYRTPGWVNLAPGDTIYLMDGNYSKLVYYGGSTGHETNGPYVACWRFEDGSEENQFHIKAYPGHSPVVDVAGGTGGGRLDSGKA